MALSIVTNTGSMMVRTNLNSATASMNTAIERMSTGYKINNAKDNAAGYNIMDTMTAKIGSFDVAYDNCQIGLDMLTTAEENYALITEHLQRIRDLTEQAANGTYSTESREAIAAEIEARMDEIDRVAKIAEYNGLGLMDASLKKDVIIQAGIYGADSSHITLDQSLFSKVSCTTIMGHTYTPSLANINDTEQNKKISYEFSGLTTSGSGTSAKIVMSFKDVSQCLSHIDRAIKDIATRVTNLGAAQNRLESAMTAIDTNIQKLTASRGTIRDADVAEESTNYISAQVLQSAASTLLATANQAPSIALQLI